jgi:hypothetical protein
VLEVPDGAVPVVVELVEAARVEAARVVVAARPVLADRGVVPVEAVAQVVARVPGGPVVAPEVGAVALARVAEG